MRMSTLSSRPLCWPERSSMPLPGEMWVSVVTLLSRSCGIFKGAGADHVWPASPLLDCHIRRPVVALDTLAEKMVIAVWLAVWYSEQPSGLGLR